MKTLVKVFLALCSAFLLFWGIIFALIAFLATYDDGIATNIFAFVMGFLAITGGVLLILLIHSKNKWDRKILRYKSTFGIQRSVPLNWVAQKMQNNIPDVIADINKAMLKGHFKGLVIDEASGMLLLPSGNSTAGYMSATNILCRACGANVQIISGYSTACKFCGTAAEYDKSVF